MKANKYILSTALIAVLILSGCRGNNDLTQKDVTPPANTGRITEQEFAAEENKVVEYTKKMDIEACTKLKASNLQILCSDNVNYKLAEKNKDAKYCNEIADNTTKEDCTYMLSVLSANY